MVAPVNQGLGRPRQEDYKFKARLGYMGPGVWKGKGGKKEERKEGSSTVKSSR